jgi:hypothetical protein
MKKTQELSVTKINTNMGDFCQENMKLLQVVSRVSSYQVRLRARSLLETLYLRVSIALLRRKTLRRYLVCLGVF